MFFKSALPFVQFLQMTVLYLVQIAIFPFREKEILFAFQTAILVGVFIEQIRNVMKKKVCLPNRPLNFKGQEGK